MSKSISKRSESTNQRKATVDPRGMVFCGVDVSAATLAVVVEPQDGRGERRTFANTALGHRQLIAWLTGKGPARVSMEATGVYHVDLALALHGAHGVEVAVLNPRDVHRVAGAWQRSKTDAADAQVLVEYCRRMDFVPWCPPTAEAFALRILSRHIESLVIEKVRIKNRIHTARASSATPACILRDLKQSLCGLHRRILALRREAIALIRAHPALERRFELLVDIPGIGETSALHLLAELMTMAPDMSVRQWIAHSGLDPQHRQSGTSVHQPSRISRHGNRHLRRALYMPALVAVRHDPHLKAFYQALLHRQKAKMQALTAVARKMLHAIYGIFKHQQPYNGAILFPNLIPTS
jgi:transposase